MMPVLIKAWRQQEYVEAVGIHTAEGLHRTLELEKGDTVYDFGCGDGHMVEWLNRKGIDTVGIDMVKVHEDTVLVNLTDMSDVYRHTPRPFGLCLGMMDHIPEPLVSQTLLNLGHLARKEIYFTIPIRDLGYNDLLGKKIQQTLKPIGWWRNRLLEIGTVKIGQTGDWMTAHVKCS